MKPPALRAGGDQGTGADAGAQPTTPSPPGPDPGDTAPTPGASLRWASATQGGPKLVAGPFMREQRPPAPHKGVTTSVKKEAAGLLQFILMPLIQFQHN